MLSRDFFFELDLHPWLKFDILNSPNLCGHPKYEYLCCIACLRIINMIVLGGRITNFEKTPII